MIRFGDTQRTKWSPTSVGQLGRVNTDYKFQRNVIYDERTDLTNDVNNKSQRRDISILGFERRCNSRNELNVVSRTSRKSHPTRTNLEWIMWIICQRETYTYEFFWVYTRLSLPRNTSARCWYKIVMKRTSSSKVIIWSQHRIVKLAIATNLRYNGTSDGERVIDPNKTYGDRLLTSNSNAER